MEFFTNLCIYSLLRYKFEYGACAIDNENLPHVLYQKMEAGMTGMSLKIAKCTLFT